jgi:hypothetical protein
VHHAGLIHLRGFPKLKSLFLYDTAVTEEGTKELKALRRCDIRP